MNVLLRNALVATSLLGFVWVGCSEDADPVDDGTDATTTSTGTPSTGSVVSSTSASVTVTSVSATTTTGGGVANCNPVTNEPCDAGAACDFDPNTGNFVCFAPPDNTEDICDACNDSGGPWCMGTMTCIGTGNICRKYCCDDSDCAPSLTCTKGTRAGFPDVGICQGEIGAGGAGGGAVAGCDDHPPTPPSNGSCVTIN